MKKLFSFKNSILSLFKILFFAICFSIPFYESFKYKNFSKEAPSANLVLEEEAVKLGVEFKHTDALEWTHKFMKAHPQIAKWFQAVSASVAVADINNDGWQDIFLSSSSFRQPSHLYINKKGEGFIEKAAEYGLDKIPNPIRSIFLDCDNDGELELFTSTGKCPLLYKKDSEGVYKKLYDFVEGPYCLFTTGLNVLDYDKDGDLDIVFGNLTRNGLPNSPVDADNGGKTVMLENIGECRFYPNDSVLNHKTLTYVNAIGVGDIFNDGSQDIWVGTDFNNDWVYKQKETFYQRLDPNKSKTLAHNAMSSEWVYLENVQYPYIFISHIFEPGYFTSGNMMWSAKSGNLKNYSQKLGLDKCGWSWGAKFADLNNDSFQDLVVSNGYISGQSHKSAFFRFRSASMMPRELAEQGAIWKAIGNLSYAGHQQDCVFININDESFQEVSKYIGFDSEALDGRGLAYADFNNDGLTDIIVANQKQRTQMYTNRSVVSGAWIGFELISNKRAAIGANLFLKLKSGRVLRRALFPYNGYSSQSDPRLHIGLGKEKIHSVHVKWLDGTEQKVEEFNINEYNLVTKLNRF